MSFLKSFSLLLAFGLLTLSDAYAIDPKEVRIARAVQTIINAQLSGGEKAAIEMLQSCYQKPLSGAGVDVVLQVEECTAQDIAYANLSASIYRNILKDQQQPSYLTIAAMKNRVYTVVMNGGLSREDADKFLRIIASTALDALGSAIEAQGKK